MEYFLRTAAIYLFLLVLFRLTGKRTLSELSTFDFILLLIISEATQNALIGEDNSLSSAMAVILTLVSLDLALAYVKKRFALVERITEGVPVILVDHGKPVDEHLRITHVTCTDIMQVARQAAGLERLEQIKYAVLETSGAISIIAMEPNIEELLDRRIEAVLSRRAERSDSGPPKA